MIPTMMMMIDESPGKPRASGDDPVVVPRPGLAPG